ncbi:MAG: acetolactate synthase small subunit [Alphaproteobacteria bacterium]|nr:acetolactate synthase small subunit [Alphaproteobacteria bacterium]
MIKLKERFRKREWFSCKSNMNEKNTKHILSIMVDNEPGVLARVVGLFSGRGYNIESLSVSEVDSHKFLSRVTIVTSGTKLIVDQIKAQLGKLIPVHNLVDISELDSFIGKELILVKLNVKNKKKPDLKEKLKKFGAVILLESNHEFIVQYAGTPEEITKLVKLLKNTKIIEQTRSGLVSMATGTDYIKK